MRKITLLILSLLGIWFSVNAQSHHFELTKKSGYFPHGASDQVAYVNFGDIQIWGWVEVTLTGGYSRQNTVGKYTKRYEIGKNLADGFFYQSSEVAVAFGVVAEQWKLGDMERNTQNELVIPIYHLVSTGNDITVNVRGVSASDFDKNLLSISTPFTLVNNETRDYAVLGGGQSVWNTSGSNINYLTGNVGIGTASPNSKLHVNGNLKVGGNLGGATLRIEATDESGAPARAVGLELHGYEGRAKGIYISDKNNVDNNWFIGEGYSYEGIGIGYNTTNTRIEYPENTKFFINTLGNVGIGTTNLDAAFKLSVGGKIRANEIKVETGWADYVFKPDYDLPSLIEVERHINEKGHLINIPSAKEVEENGVELGEMNKLLLEKIEELTLYILKMDKEIQELKSKEQR